MVGTREGEPRRAHEEEAPVANTSMAKQRKTTGPKLLGTVQSTTSSLSLLVGDAKVVAMWAGVGKGDVDDSDWERARRALEKRDASMIDIGKQLALALTLAVGHGTARIYQLVDHVAVVEAIADAADPSYLVWLASPPEKKTRSAAMLATPSKKLTVVSITDAGTTGISLPVATKVAVAIEPPATGTWGSGRRCFISSRSA
jgi:hypothetical protein